MKQWRTVRSILKYSWKPLFQFELLYKLLAITVFAPLFSLMFRGILELIGYSYLTIENIFSFLKSPLTWVLIFLLLLLLSLLSVSFQSDTALLLSALQELELQHPVPC